jgi:hypothetical protein
MSIINIIKYQYPLSILAIPQPVVHKLKDISLGIPPSKQLDHVGNLPITLLKPGRVAGMDPENPYIRRPVVGLICIFNRKLRFPLS